MQRYQHQHFTFNTVSPKNVWASISTSPAWFMQTLIALVDIPFESFAFPTLYGCPPFQNFFLLLLVLIWPPCTYH